MRIKLLMGVCAAMTLGTQVAKASLIPPHHPPTVITRCGQVTTVFTSTRTGFLRHTGADAIRIANKVPFNLRVESGCGK